MSDEQRFQIDRLNGALEVSNRTIVSLERKISVLQDLVERMEHDKKNWEQLRTAQESIMRKTLEFADEEKRKLQDEIIELKRELKILKAE